MRGTPFIHEGFVGGLNSIDSPYTIEDSEARNCLNVVSTTRGSIRKRTGSTVFSEALAGTELQSAFPVTISGTKSLIITGGTKIFKVSTAGGTTTIGEGFTSNLRWSIVQAPTGTGVSGKGPVYMTNGTDAPQTWTGAGNVAEWTGLAAAVEKTDGEQVSGSNRYTSKTANFVGTDVGLEITGENIPANTVVLQVLSSTTIELSNNCTASGTGKHFTLKRTYYETAPHVPKGKYMVFAGNRIWMTGIGTDESAVWFTELVSIGEGGAQGDPTAWPKANVVRFDHSDGKPITGIGLNGPYVVVFKERKTWIIHDLNTGANRRLSDTVGCVSHRSIVETQGGTFFLTADQGVYLLAGGTQLHEMSYKVRPTILAINQEKREQASGTYYNNHYYLSFPKGTSATNNRTLDYDVQLKVWFLHDLAPMQWAIWNPESEVNLYGVKTNVILRAFVPEVFSDLGVKYTGEEVAGEKLSAFWFGAWQPFYAFIFRHRVKQPGIKKRVRQLHFDGSGEIIPIVAKNFSESGTQLPASPGATPENEPKLPVNFAEGEQLWANPNEEQKWAGETYQGVTMLWGGASATQDARIYSLGTAKLWSVGFGNSSKEPFQIDSFTLAAQFRKS